MSVRLTDETITAMLRGALHRLAIRRGLSERRAERFVELALDEISRTGSAWKGEDKHEDTEVNREIEG